MTVTRETAPAQIAADIDRAMLNAEMKHDAKNAREDTIMQAKLKQKQNAVEAWANFFTLPSKAAKDGSEKMAR